MGARVDARPPPGAGPVEVLVHPQKDVGSELEPLLDLVGEPLVARVGLREVLVEALGVRHVELLVGLVVDELALLEPAALHDRGADLGRDPREQVLDDAEGREPREPVVERAEPREDRVEGAHLGPERAPVGLVGRDPEPPEELEERPLVTEPEVPVAVLVAHVLEEVEPHVGRREARREDGHGPREEGDRVRELDLRLDELLARQGAVAERPEVRVLERSDAFFERVDEGPHGASPESVH